MANGETITITKAEYQELLGYKSRVAVISHELAQLKRMVFGAKSERFIASLDPGQLTLFEQPAEEAPAQGEEEQISYKRKKPQGDKKQPLRAELPAHLPRKQEVIEPGDLPEGAKKIGEAVSEILEYQPANIYVRQIIRPKYIVEANDEQTQIAIGAMPTLPIPKGNAGAGMLAHLLISKFVDHLPFYRQVQMLKRDGITIAESTISGWFNGACRLLEPLYDALMRQLLMQDYLMVDETPLPVLTKDKPGATHKGYHWVYYSPIKRLVLFDYRKSRGRDGPNTMLEHYQGYLQTDGYAAYENLNNQQNITLLACMAHARRYFDKARDNDPTRAEKALNYFQQLYAIEQKARERELDPEPIKVLREEEAMPILKQMEDWFKEDITQVLPQSAIGKAFAYNLKLWNRLKRYVEDGRLHIDNNPVENSIRPVALGRKNYLFAGSHDAAHKAAMIYSLLATCKINGVEPFNWLKETLSIIPDHPANKLHELLPGQ